MDTSLKVIWEDCQGWNTRKTHNHLQPVLLLRESEYRSYSFTLLLVRLHSRCRIKGINSVQVVDACPPYLIYGQSALWLFSSSSRGMRKFMKHIAAPSVSDTPGTLIPIVALKVDYLGRDASVGHFR